MTLRPTSNAILLSSTGVLQIVRLDLGAQLAHAIHQTVQHNIHVNVLSAFHELGHHAAHLMPAEAHGADVINDLLQGHSVNLSLTSTLQHMTIASRARLRF